MAMKKARPPKQPQKSDDTVIYNVMIALALVCLAIIALLQVGRLADYTDTMVQTYDATIYVAIIGAAVALASFIASLLLGSKMGKTALRICALVFGAIAVSAALLRIFWTPVIPLLYFAYIAAGVLYLIYMIYQKEFFLLSCLTTVAGLCFYLFSKSMSRVLVLYGLAFVLTLLAVLVCVMAYRASKENGVLRIGKKQVFVFSSSYNPVFLYITSAVWVLCLLATFLLGGMFAYYCMFAAIAYELVAACYYTIKLS